MTGIRIQKLKAIFLPDTFVLNFARRTLIRKYKRTHGTEEKVIEHLKQHSIETGDIELVKEEFKKALQLQEKENELIGKSESEIVEVLRRAFQKLLDLYEHEKHPGLQAEIGSILQNHMTVANNLFKETLRFEQGSNIRLSPSSVEKLLQEAGLVLKNARRAIRKERKAVTNVQKDEKKHLYDEKAAGHIKELKETLAKLDKLLYLAFDDVLIAEHKELVRESETDEQVLNQLKDLKFPKKDLDELVSLYKQHMQRHGCYQELRTSLNTLQKWFMGKYNESASKKDIIKFEQQQEQRKAA